jgi:CDP-4-dehydro-6-deoxyglucose reductase
MTVKKTLAQVERVTPLTDSIIELILSPQDFIDYQPGQYLKILCGEEALSFSIANAPLGSHKYELHIRHDQGNPYNQPLFAAIKREGRVQVVLPYGDCYLNQLQPDKPVLFIAGGTGFAPIKAMIEQMQSDLYMDDKVRQWQAHVSRFRYVTLLSGESRENLASVVQMDYSDSLLHHQIVIAGPFEMVYAIRDALVAFGMPREQLFSDAFNFESEDN